MLAYKAVTISNVFSFSRSDGIGEPGNLLEEFI
jgi:hypothetical protein